jgi:hypothetical protein
MPLGPKTPYARATTFVGSLRIAKSRPCDSAKRALVAGASTLAAKYATPSRLSASPLDLSDLHSAVHPPVNALGNHAITTPRCPLKSRR